MFSPVSVRLRERMRIRVTNIRSEVISRKEDASIHHEFVWHIIQQQKKATSGKRKSETGNWLS